MKDTIFPSAAINADSAHSDSGIFSADIRKKIHLQAHVLIKCGWFPEHMKKDLEQELSLVLLAESEHFDPAKSSFPTFAKHVLKKRSLNLIERARTIKAGADIEMLSLDISVNEEGESLVELLDFDSIRIAMGVQSRSRSDMGELCECVAHALTLLNPELREICIAIMDGESISGLARRYGMSRPGFRKAYFPQIQKVFLDAGLGEF